MKINQHALVTAIVKAGKLSFEEKEAVADEIFAEQPNLLASVLVQQQFGNSLDHTGVLLSILMVCHLARY